jgi:hypothetical protein
MRDRLIELIGQARAMEASGIDCKISDEYIADYLLANGVVVIDMDVVSPKNRPLITQCFGIPIDEVIKRLSSDVVPKSEVKNAKQEVAREIFEEIEKNSKFTIQFVEAIEFDSEEIRKAKLECYRDCLGYFQKLKKKYTKESEGK